MKIILCCHGNICEDGMLRALKKLGHEVVICKKESGDMDYDKAYFNELADLISKNADIRCVISMNFVPIVARACKPFKIPYLSLTADSPCTTLNSKTTEYDTNRIFLFDQMQFQKYVNYNPEHTFYLPLAGDPEYLDSYVNNITLKEHQMYDCDISFIGSLYTEKCKYNTVGDKLSEYTKGYVEGLLSAQQNVYGYNFIEDALSPDWIKNFKKELAFPAPAEDYRDDTDGIIADLYLGYKCSELERIHILHELSANHNVDLYTLSDTSSLPNVNNKGPADSVTMMPKIFRCSKINLNMTNRAIKTGLPLRIFDILSAGGFLISNYQSEIPEYFSIDEDIVVFESIGDLLEKVDFYLSRDDLREQIAANGNLKVREAHTYIHRLEDMLSCC